MRVLSSICSGARLGPLRAPAAERGVVHDPLVKDALRHARVAAAQRLGFGRTVASETRHRNGCALRVMCCFVFGASRHPALPNILANLARSGRAVVQSGGAAEPSPRL